MHLIARIAAWSLLVCSSAAVAFLPLTERPSNGPLTVVFYPWVSQKAQLTALVQADVYVTGRPSRFAFSGFVFPEWDQVPELRKSGAFLITSSAQIALCRPTQSQDPVREGTST